MLAEAEKYLSKTKKVKSEGEASAQATITKSEKKGSDKASGFRHV
jgi:hypothetical protein